MLIKSLYKQDYKSNSEEVIPLNSKQQLFISEYLTDFNATQAAIRAGYSVRSAGSIANELLKKPDIQQALQATITARNNNLIADREERKRFWSRVMLDENENMKHRLKASELLAKSEGDFIQQVKAEIKEFNLADFVMSECRE